MYRLVIFWNCSIHLHERCAPASADPQCESIDTNVTCWGDGELLQAYVQESGVFRSYTHAKIEEGITVLGTGCFQDCSSLYFIDLPSSVVQFKGSAFQGTNFTTFTVGKYITTLSSTVWNTCGSLTHFYVESGNTKFSASDGFLFQNENLFCVAGGRGRGTKLTLPDCTTILTSAMRWNHCTELVISDKTTTIKDNAFYAGRFTNLTLGKSLSTIHYLAFSKCNNLARINLNGNTNFYLKDGLFGKQDSAKNPTSILWVSEDISSSITIAKTITEIGGPWLQLRANLTSISVESGSTVFSVACSNMLVVDTNSNNKWTRACHCIGGATSITVPSNIVTINNGCFRECSLLTKVILHSGVNCIYDDAFRHCANMESIDFKGCTMKRRDGQTQTATNMISDCTKLKTIVTWPSNTFQIGGESWQACGFTILELPDQCTMIGDRGFRGCSNLETLIIPKTMTSIGSEAFYQCKLLKNVTFVSVSTLTKVSALTFGECTSLNTITLPSTITDITASCFALSQSLTEINFAGETTNFVSFSGAVYQKSGNNKYYTFYICPPGLTTVTLHDETNEIGTNAVYGCGKLTEVFLNDKLVKIGTNAFMQCNLIEFIRIPGTVSYIEKRAFVLCANLQRIHYCSDNDSIEYDGDPFPSNPAVYLLAGSNPVCNFCGHKCERILDMQCNIPTLSFTSPSRGFRPIKVGIWSYIYMCVTENMW